MAEDNVAESSSKVLPMSANLQDDNVAESSSKDLPMSANLQDITVRHFILNLTCKMEQRLFEGCITLLCRPTVDDKSVADDRTENCNSGSVISVKGKSVVSGRTERCSSASITDAKNTQEKDCIDACQAYSLQDAACFDASLQSDRNSGIAVEGHQSSRSDNNVLSCVQQSDTHSDFQHSLLPERVNVTVSASADLQPNTKCESRSSDPQDSVTVSFHGCHSSSTQVARDAAHKSTTSFKMVLDSYKLDVQRVEGMFFQDGDRQEFEQNTDGFIKRMMEQGLVPDFSDQQYQWNPIDFLVKEHCIHISMDTAYSPKQFPHAVRIWYSTHPGGPSLAWTKDQDGNSCVFTIGHFLNNRSLFPSQDAPAALPTWHAEVTASGADVTVLLTGDRAPLVTPDTQVGSGLVSRRFSYSTSFPMPASTLAIAVGQWEMEELTYNNCSQQRHQESSLRRPTLRLFFPQALRERSRAALGGYLPPCVLEAQCMLGTYPLHRLDVLIVPACFDSLGMASPSLLLVSQSVLCGDGSMCVRVAHELCHTWFGVAIGPRDWTEEWMTEGFCTYLEDILHARVCQAMQPWDDAEAYVQLKAQLRLRVLKAELQNTDENLQSLRPNKGRAEAVSADQTTFLKNGMNVDKKFIQLHYLKGYFLLQMLEKRVGRAGFLSFLRRYVQKFIFQLVTSQDFFQAFFGSFSDLPDLTLETINRDWLDSPGLPQPSELRLVSWEQVTFKWLEQSESVYNQNYLSTKVTEQLSLVSQACRPPSRGKRRRGRVPRPTLPTLDRMSATQVVLLFDLLLEEERLPGHVLDLLKRVHGLHLDNAEVCHAWCELVVKHRHSTCYPDLQAFFLHHQALGVYLYGEAMISGCPDAIQLARTCFRQLEHDMPEGVRETVSAMLYAT